MGATKRLTLSSDLWHYTTDGQYRMYFAGNGMTYIRGCGDIPFRIFNSADANIFSVTSSGYLSAGAEIGAWFRTVANNSRDLLGIQIEDSQNVNAGYNFATVKVIQGTFTGFHRCFTSDMLFDKNNILNFKHKYCGRLVISTGKIATDISDNENNWDIKYDKDGITIEDALPIIELSRIKKDKRIFGVFGDPTRSNSRPERMIINSVGEGGIWVCNSNGNIENGDYITSSNYLGYGEKQDDDLLHNYTVAKATISCNFELDTNLYICIEIENGLRAAFISCTYHCG